MFAEALGRYPKQTWSGKPEFHLNYGIALAKLGELDKSIEQMKIALDAKPDLPEIWESLGFLYQGSGRLEDALVYYQELIRRFPNRPEAIIIIDLVKALEDEIRIARSHGDAASKENVKDYYAAITRGGAKLWPARKMPLKVHIQSGDGVAGFKPKYAEILKEAFDEWSKASQGKVTFKFVDNSADADILCSWASDSSQFKNRSEGGETLFVADSTGLMEGAKVVILTVATTGAHGVSDNEMRVICLHEVGHALGLAGHSPNPADIMFFGATPADSKKDLSERDRQTLLRLYAPPKASVVRRER